MKLLQTKLIPLAAVIDFVKKHTDSGDLYDFKCIGEAPWYVRLLAKGTYCAYNTTVYVPDIHLALVKSKHEGDRNLGTAKLLPYIMAIHDNTFISFPLFIKLLFSTRYQAHYFIYEFLFLKYTDHVFKEPIFTGFMTSRTNILGVKRSFETIEAYMYQVFNNSDQSSSSA